MLWYTSKNRWKLITIIIVIVSSGYIYLYNNHSSNATTPPFFWVDTHVHLRGNASSFQSAINIALQAKTEWNIYKHFIMPQPSLSSDQSQDYLTLEGIAKSHPNDFDFLGGGASLNPTMHSLYNSGTGITKTIRNDFQSVADSILAYGALGFGEMAATHFSIEVAEGIYSPYQSVPADYELFLLLAHIAALNNVPIDLHHDVVVEDITLPSHLPVSNPPILNENYTSLKSLLSKRPNTKIVWVHAGSDETGHRTTDLMRELLATYPKLYMSITTHARGGVPSSLFDAAGNVTAEWLGLLNEFRDRFVVGSDSTYADGQTVSDQPDLQVLSDFLSQLNPVLARQIAYDNVVAIYGRTP